MNVFFIHDDSPSTKSSESEQRQSKYCPEGDKCEDQSCQYTEANHKNMNSVLCRFQSKCNRSDCVFKHLFEKASFLGDCRANSKRK